LLAAAREVFLARGIRATTVEVAERAGVSEGTLFHRFKSKEGLFRAAMRLDEKNPPEILGRLSELAGKGDLRANLVAAAEELVEVARVALPVMMMSWSNPAEDLASIVRRRADGYQRAFQSVCAFFEGEARAGRLKASEPEALARIFIGSLHHYCLSDLLVVEGQTKKGRLGPSAFVHALVEAVLKAGGHEERERNASPLHRKLRRV